MAHPMLTPVTSSSIASYGHFRIGIEAPDHKTLFVEFLSGKVYRYEVPLQICEDIDKATSFGGFVNQMKSQYVGTEIGGSDLSSSIQAAIDAGSSKPKKTRKAQAPRLSRAILLAMPQLEYFF